MSFPSESKNNNSKDRDFEKNDRSSDSNPLENLFNLLNELIEEEEPSSEISHNNVRENSKTQTTNFRFQEKSNSDLQTPNLSVDIASNTIDKESSNSNSEILFQPIIAAQETNTEVSLNITENLDRFGDSTEEKAKKGSLKNDNSVEEITSKDVNNLTLDKITDNLDRSQNKPTTNNKRSTTNSPALPDFQSSFDSSELEDIEKKYVSQQWIREKERQIDELANSVNNLIPLVVQLSTSESKNSQEYILKAIVPIIDRVIQQRSVEDRQKMASAIADILPSAIQEEISKVPESIGKAIAPEIALSIQEQIKIKEGAIANALGSEMGKAIENQIQMEREAMVDALYPVIGSTISKYMGEVVASINEKVDAALSPVGIQRKIRAKLQGVSEAELILRESLPSSIRAIFLIHNASGLVIQELQPDTDTPLESDLLAGMLTAIRSFANDCIAANSELDRIDYDNFQILFETAGYCYLAVVVNGEPSRQFRDRMRDVFSKILLKYGDEIERYQGNPATIPRSIQLLLKELVYESTKADRAKPPKALYWLTAFLLGAIVIPSGIVWHRSTVAKRIERVVKVELDATPELSVYRLIPDIKQGKLTLTGRVPSNYLKNLAATTTQSAIAENNLKLDNQIVAVRVPVDPTITDREVARLTEVINQKSTTILQTNYQNRTVTINALILNPQERKELIANFREIPGVENVVFIGTQQLPELKTRIYFASNTSDFSLDRDSAKIEEIIAFLNKYPSIELKIIGHSDRQGIKENNLELARERANKVYRALIDRGIDPQRLITIASSTPPPDILEDSSQPLWLSRCVRFESFLGDKP